MNLDRAVKICVIIACIVMFCYTMIYYPWQCHEITVLSGGSISCGLNVGAYLLAIVICVTATVAAIMLIE